MRGTRVLLSLCCLPGALSAFAQLRSRPKTPGLSQSRSSGCPSSAVPVARDSVATATDFVELKRGGCAGACPAYTVRVWGDGRVLWSGAENVARKGTASALIDTNDARTLMQRFADRGFWGLCSLYSASPGDGSDDTTTLSIAGHARAIEDLGGAAPSWLRGLDVDLERVSNTHPWRHGAPETETFAADHLRTDAVLPKTGVTPLMTYASLPDTASLRKWLQTLPVVNERDSSGWTALMYAAQAGPLEAMNLLLRAGGDPLLRSNAGESVLAAAVTSPDQPAARVRLLLDGGAEINAADRRGVTVLMRACQHFSSRGLVALLLELGADPSKRDVDGAGAVDYVLRSQGENRDPVGFEAARQALSRREQP